MKNFLRSAVCAFGLVASVSMATSVKAVDVAGHFVYKMPEGEVVVRNATLDVPPRGQGKVILKYTGGSIESDKFRTRKHNGRIVFEVAFMNPPGAPANTVLGMTGSYINGKNGVVYYGDTYGKVMGGGQPLSELSDDALFNFDDSKGPWQYTGGFEFNTVWNNKY